MIDTPEKYLGKMCAITYAKTLIDGTVYRKTQMVYVKYPKILECPYIISIKILRNVEPDEKRIFYETL